jgi:hypothetical protein
MSTELLFILETKNTAQSCDANVEEKKIKACLDVNVCIGNHVCRQTRTTNSPSKSLVPLGWLTSNRRQQ